MLSLSLRRTSSFSKAREPSKHQKSERIHLRSLCRRLMEAINLLNTTRVSWTDRSVRERCSWKRLSA